uniref:Uncharacterized protein n=1 Tax=viral metagenome TaxID=1070528 RepID=A0A6M3JZH4_9ZZZZ
MNFVLLHDAVRVRKCIRDHIRKSDGSVLLYRPDDSRQHGDMDETAGRPWLSSRDMTNWAEIIDVGPDCATLTKDDIGKRILCPEMGGNEMQRLVQEDFAIRERLLLKCYPFLVDMEDDDAKQEQ